LADGNDDDDNG